MSLGLALSGGGSRAMAFHCGTLKALWEIGLLNEVDVVSTVSGGSIFGAAWITAIKEGRKIEDFLSDIRREIKKGFILRSLKPRAAKMALLGLTRTNVLADTFDELFFKGLKLGELPEKPKLCLNVCLLNNGHLGKFSKCEFRCAGIVPKEKSKEYSVAVKMENYPLSLAATASAAYPGLLAPIYLKRGEKEIPEGWGKGDLEKHKRFALVDGGVVDNLGVQSLLSVKSGFSVWDLIVSDAGTKEELWEPKNVVKKTVDSAFKTFLAVFGAGVGWISLDDLLRVTSLMFSKEVRQMRRHIFEEQELSWLKTAIENGQNTDSLKEWMEQSRGSNSNERRRKLLFVRINQNWDKLLSNIPRWRLVELNEKKGMPKENLPNKREAKEVEDFLAKIGIDLSKEKKLYQEIEKNDGSVKANKIDTSFSALSEEEIEILYGHALWQTHLLFKIYW